MPDPPAPSKSGSVKLPGVGPVPKKWFVIVGVASLATIAYLAWKKKKQGAAAPAATDAGTAALAGQPCVDANGNPGVYDSSGICQVDTAALGGYYAGSGALGTSGVTPPVPGTGGFTTNGQWTQQAELDMQGTGVDPGTLAAALGAYITGRPVTPDQQSLIDQAIAFEGYPPVAGPSGYPPAIKLQAAAGQTTTPPPDGTGTTSASAPPTVTGLKATGETTTSVGLAWNASATATSYQVRVTYQTQVIQTHMVTGTSFTVTGLTPDHTYGLHVVAINAHGWASEASIVQKTPR